MAKEKSKKLLYSRPMDKALYDTVVQIIPFTPSPYNLEFTYDEKSYALCVLGDMRATDYFWQMMNNKINGVLDAITYFTAHPVCGS